MKKSMKQLLALIMAMSLSLSLLSANVWASDKADGNFISAQRSCEGITTDAASAEGQLFSTGKPKEADVVKSESTTLQEKDYDSEGLIESTLVKKPSSTTEDSPSVDEDISQKEKDSEDAQRILQVMDDDYDDYEDYEDYEDTNESGKCGERLFWEYSWATGVLTISGSGAMANWDDTHEAPWSFLRDEIVSLAIQNGVTSIGNHAFYECYKLSSVNIGNDVTIIGDEAFASCESLNSIAVPDSVLRIGSNAFAECVHLKEIQISNNVTTIGDSAFGDCIALSSFNIPDSITSVGEAAFSGCKNMSSITIGNNITSIRRALFSGCSHLSNVNLPNSITRIDEWAFTDCSALTSIDIPSSVNAVGEYAFEGCTKLKSITIPRSVTKIGMGAFGYIFGKTGDTPISGFSLSGYTGSAAESYAIENGFPFTSLNGVTKKPGTITGKTTFSKTINAKKNQAFNLGASANGAHLSYRTSNKNVTVSKTGKVTIKKGFVGNVTITITSTETDKYLPTTRKVILSVKPSATQFSSVKWDAKKKVANVSWKKNATGKGYEVQYSTNKKFKQGVKKIKIGKNGTVKATIKGLKAGKTYYVRIRTVHGKVYSDWSKTKSVKVKK